MLEFKNLSIITNRDREIIKDLNITINSSDKLAIIGEEGNGKSTLLKCVCDVDSISSYCYITGDIIKRNIKIGYLEQFLNEKWKEYRIEDYFMKEDIDGEVQYEKYNEIHVLKRILKDLNLLEDFLESDKVLGNLSGGEKVKVQIAKLLFYESEILLLDEPTNDIDIETLEWLEEYIKNSDIPIVYISHDETLLENTANCILHLEQLSNKTKSKWTYEKIGYKEYVEKRKHLLERQDQMALNEKREHEKQMDKFRQIYQSVEYKQDTITRQDPAGGRLLKKRMKTVKALEKRLDDKELTKRPEIEEKILVKFHNENTIHGNKVILDYHLNTLEVASKVLKKDINIQVYGQEKLCITGKNGSGKTTLMKRIYLELKDRNDINVGYMPQDYDELLDLEVTPLHFLQNDYTREEETMIRTYLASVKFTQEEILGNISNLSGGQKAKLFILKLVIDKNDVLLLDEPTRNLSPLSNPVIRDILKNFNGSIISISHDRKYINEVCDKTYEM